MIFAATVVVAALSVAFPSENQQLPNVPCTYVIGGVETNDVALSSRAPELFLNGVSVPIYRTGAFLAMVQVKPGTNVLELAYGTNMLVRTFRVAKPEPPGAGESKPRPPRNPYEDLGIPSNVVYAAKPPAGSRPRDVTVMVDAGHGGPDAGAISPRGLKEKDFNLAQAKEIAASLRRAGFKVIMTRDDDSFPALYDRPRAAIREKADCFVSVHHNATACQTNPRRVRHVTTYASNSNGLALAACVQKHLAHVVAPVRDSGAQIKSLAVCRNPAVPSCLLEVDFINLPEGEEASLDPVRMKKVATAVTCGVLDWLQ